MENEETKPTPPKENSLESFASELETIQASLRKRKSETTTLKILFYTGLAVLLFGFMYTNQTLQRAQHHSLESNINLLQNQINHTLVLLEKKLHDEIQELDAKVNGTLSLHERIQNMNQALDQLEPQSTSAGILIEKVQRDAKELSQMMQELETQEDAFSTREIFAVE